MQAGVITNDSRSACTRRGLREADSMQQDRAVKIRGAQETLTN